MDNQKLNKFLNEKYFLISDLIKKYDYSEELISILTLIYTSFYLNLGKDCDYPLYDLFEKVKIIYEQGNVNDISIRNGYGEIPDEVAAVTVFKPNLNVFINPKIKQNPQVIISGTHIGQTKATPILKLEMLIHEIRHALMGYYKTNFLIDDKTYYMRCGIGETYYINKTNKKVITAEDCDIKEQGRTLDEILNSYITEILINKILSLKENKIENNSIRTYLNKLKTNQSNSKYIVLNYHSEVKLMYPLLLNEIFLNTCNIHAFDGELENIKDLITNYSDYFDFDIFCQKLDDIFLKNIQYAKAMNLLKQKDDSQMKEFIFEHIKNINDMKKVILNLNDNIKNKFLIKK